MQNIFETKSNYNTRNVHFLSRKIKTDMDYRPSPTWHLMWDLVPKEIKIVTTLNEFKAKIKI